MTTPFDSTADTLRHSLRVADLMSSPIKELLDRSIRHDLSKTVEPERSTYNEFVPKLNTATYGSEEYQAVVAAMGDGLAHHYANNRHHPEHFPNGVRDMTLVDLIEMLADWKAATERGRDGDLAQSMEIHCERFGLAPQLMDILRNTARHYGWLPAQPGHDLPTEQPAAATPHCE